jgi:hypothetical protein
MAVIDGASETGYWALVEATMTQVFDATPHVARSLISARWQALAEVTTPERLLEFNVEPLDVAADLLRKEVVEANAEDYLKVRRLAGDGRQAAVAVAFPRGVNQGLGLPRAN